MATDDRRATRVWTRLTQSYGARFQDTMGTKPTAPWLEEIEKLTNDQLAYGLRMISRVEPIYPPTVGQFVKCCESMPIAQQAQLGGPTVQEQLTEYLNLKGNPAGVRVFVYREWSDATLPKHSTRCAECVGVVVELSETLRVGYTVEQMHADTDGHKAVMRKFDRSRNRQQLVA